MKFSDYEYSLRKRKTKREAFLEIMDEIIPWDEWTEFVRIRIQFRKLFLQNRKNAADVLTSGMVQFFG